MKFELILPVDSSDVELRVPRLRKCQCALDSPVQGSGNATLRQRWIAPELKCVQSELAAVLPYARSAELLSKLLPHWGGQQCQHSTRSHLARRTTPGIEAGGCARETARSSHAPASRHDSRPGRWLCSPLRPRCRALLEIIAGRLLADDGAQSSVGFVRTVDQHSRTRVQRAVAEQGKSSDNLMVFTDGDSRLRDLQLSVLPRRHMCWTGIT
jgi:hypothetical protein